MEGNPREVLTILERSLYPKILKSTLYKLAREGKVHFQKARRYWRLRKVANDYWLEETQAGKSKSK